METRIHDPITDGQIEKAVDIFRSVLRKHRTELNSEAVQHVLGLSELGPELLAVIRQHVETVSNLIVRRVRVDRSRSLQEVLDATSWRQYTDRGVVAAMPGGGSGVEEAEVVFFRLGRYVSDKELEKEYLLRGLVPADPYSLAAVNEADSAFADDYPNGTHWKDVNGRWRYAAFGRWGVERRVVVDRDAYGWGDDWWFAGLRK